MISSTANASRKIRARQIQSGAARKAAKGSRPAHRQCSASAGHQGQYFTFMSHARRRNLTPICGPDALKPRPVFATVDPENIGRTRMSKVLSVLVLSLAVSSAANAFQTAPPWVQHKEANHESLRNAPGSKDTSSPSAAPDRRPGDRSRRCHECFHAAAGGIDCATRPVACARSGTSNAAIPVCAKRRPESLTVGIVNSLINGYQNSAGRTRAPLLRDSNEM